MRVPQAFELGIAIGSMVSIGAVTAAESETDPVKLSQQLYDVRFENDRVRVLEYRLKPGQKEPMHSHPPGVVYMFSDATFRTAENIGDTEAHALAVELKPCR